MERQGTYQKAGGHTFLCDCLRAPTSAGNIEAYADAVRQHHQRRAILEIGRRANSASDLTVAPLELAAGIAAEARLIAEDALTGRDPGPTLGGVWADVQEALERRATGTGPTGVRTGLPAIDDRLGGLQPGRLYVLCGTPGSGKTALATWFLAQHCIKAGEPAVFFSAEMSAQDVYRRMVQQVGGIDGGNLARGRLTAQEQVEFVKWGAALARTRLDLDDTAAIPIEQLVHRGLHLCARRGSALVVVDYLQLLTSQQDKETFAAVARCARELKRLAREANVAVVVLSQLTMTDNGPRARWSRDIEQAADAVLFIRRRDDVERNEEAEPDVVVHRVTVTKNRFGPQVTFYLEFDKPRMAFRQVTRRDYDAADLEN